MYFKQFHLQREVNGVLCLQGKIATLDPDRREFSIFQFLRSVRVHKKTFETRYVELFGIEISVYYIP